jgi:cytochrome c2
VNSIRATPRAAGEVLPSGSGAAGLLAEGELEQGEVVVQKCYACDPAVPGENGLTGRNLFGAVGERSRAADLACSAPLVPLPAQRYRVWTEAALDAYLSSPEDFARERHHVRRAAGSKRARRHDRVSRAGAGSSCRGVRQCA